MTGALIVAVVLAVLVLVVIAKTAVVVPQQSAYVVERLGRYSGTLQRRLPHPDAVRRRHPLPALAEGDGGRHPGAGLHHARQRAGRRRRRALPQGAQPRARVVRHLRLHVRDHASSRRRRCAARSARSISTRRSRSAPTSTPQVVSELDKASEPWGVKVLRYEIKNITPPHDILAAMEKQMRAEREKRAVILTSEGAARRRDQHRRRREAAGHQGVGSAAGSSRSTRPRARPRRSWRSRPRPPRASASVAEAITLPGGFEAVQLRVAEQYIAQFGELRQEHQHDDPAGQRRGRGVDDRDGDDHHPRAAAGRAARPALKRGIECRRRAPPPTWPGWTSR